MRFRRTGSSETANGSRRGRGSVALVGFLIAVAGLPALTAPAGAEGAGSRQDEAPRPVIPKEIADDERLPFPAYPDENTITDPETVTPSGFSPGKTVEAVTAGLTPLPDRGGPNFDVFGTGPSNNPHAAIVYPDVVNYQETNGSWRRLPTEYAADPSGGWRANALGVEVRLPARLSTAQPLRMQFPGGTASVAPIGADAPGTPDGPTVTYADALPSVDLVYGLDGGGYVEDIVLRDPTASGTVTYELVAPGFEVASTERGVELRRAGAPVALLSAALAFDSATPPATTVPTLGLTPVGPQTWHVQVGVDPGFLAAATYPVTIDPAFTTNVSIVSSGIHDDTYVSAAAPTSSFVDATRLLIAAGSAAKNSFLYFDTSAFEREGIVVYPDTEAVTRFSTDSSGSGTVEIHRVSGAWPSSPMTWNNQPPIDPQVEDSLTLPSWGPGWWFWDVADLYQQYLDLRPQIHVSNQGIAMTTPSTTAFPSVISAEGGACCNAPFLTLVYNNLPEAPILDVPADGFISENDSPTLKVKGGVDWPTDPDGESVLVQVQISDDPSFSNPIEYQSGFSDERAFVVPTGVLVDGQTYYWRAQSWDVCIEPSSMCDNNGVELMSSPARALTISLKHFGDDPRYAMWSHDAGNGVTIKVNEANGNLFLDVPMDSLATPIGDLSVGLSYNSQQNADFGVTPGWSLDIGPSSSVRDLPIELVKQTPFPDAGIKVRLGGGRAFYFPHRERKVFASVGPGSGVVKQNHDGTFLYTAADGGQYEFNVGGKMVRADPVASAAAHGDFGFDYAYNAQGELQSVTDPLGRVVSINWLNNRPDTITPWTGEIWTLSYTGSHLTAVRVHVTNPVTGLVNTEKVGFTYDGSDTVSEIDNGVTSDLNRTGWTVTYQNDPTGLRRVASVTAPPGGGPATPPTPWTFQYSGPYRGTTATYACVTDPLGSPGVACTGQHQTKVDFNTAGLPIGITGPMDQTGYFPVTTMIWDSNNNLVCRRTPAANAAALIQFNPAQPTSTACQDDARSTKYVYRNQAPFQLLIERKPVGSQGGGGTREVVFYDYDRDLAGGQFNGLWAETFTNRDLKGVPKDSLVWGDMDESWGTGSPPNLPQDNFSIRWSGLLDISDFGSAKKIAFRITTVDEGVSLVVSNKVLLDCLGTTQPAGSYNCGTNQDVKSLLLPGFRPIVVEYADLGGNASFKLEWDQGNGTWQTIPPHRLQTNIGLLTKQTLSQGDSTPILETKHVYATDWEKSRQLPTEIVVTDISANPDEVRRTTLTYGQYGQVLTTTTAAGTSLAATTTNDYTFQGTTSCLTKVTDPTGAVTNFLCNSAGDVTKVTQKVRSVALQAEQDRVTDTVYDDLGRVVKVLLPSGGYTETTYDKAGRPISVTRNLGTGAGHDATATTTYTYDDAGHLLTETLPRVLNPATGQLATPTITHTWDWLDDETRTVDLRGKTWNHEYDALRRMIKTTSPSGLVTETEYRLFTSGTGYDHKVTTWTPPGKTTGVPMVSAMDVNGRVTSQKLGTLDATTSTYDPLGRMTSTSAPPASAPVVTNYTYNGFGQTTTMVEFATATTPYSPSTTTYAYDAAGRLASVDGPRSITPNDLTSYTYDLVGRLSTVNQQGITLPGGGAVITTYTHDDAGELVRASQPLTSTLTQVRDFTFDTSGRMASAVDARGTTTYTYGAGDQLEQVGDPRGITLRFEYDNLGRQTRRYRSAPSVADDQTFTYDQAANLLSAKVVATGTTISATYDADGRLWKVYQASAQPTTTYTYNASTGRLSSIADPAGTTGYAAYDPNGLLTQIDDPLSSINVIYSYDSAGRVIKRTDGGKLCTERVYEPKTGRIDKQTVKGGGTACSGSAIASFDLGYDAASNVTSRVQSVGTGTGANPHNGTYAYTYDAAGRLVSATGPSSFGSRTYGYDGAGNRTSVQVGTGTPVTTTYDAAGLPVSSSDGTTYTHDAVGNLTAIDRTGSSNDRFFTHSSWNTTTKAASTPAGSDVVFTLDALDRVLSRTSGSTTATSTYQGLGETLAKAQVGNSSTTYTSTPGGPLGQKAGNTTRYYVRDLHGDLVAFSDNKAAFKGTAAYDPFGQVLSATGEMGTIPAQGALRFQGDLTDAFTGQVDMGARWYEPVLGRFSSADPLQGELTDPLSLNRFVYGMASPLTYTDPTGLKGKKGGGGGGCGRSCQEQIEEEIEQERSEIEAGSSGDGPALDPPIASDPRVEQLEDQAVSCMTQVGALPRMGCPLQGVISWFLQTTDGPILAFTPITVDPFGGLDGDSPDPEGSYFRNVIGREARDEAARRSVSVIGRYPAYLKLAEELDAHRFDVPKDVWSRLSPEEQWAANRKFLDRAIARGDEFVLATPVAEAPVGSAFLREVKYLLAQGYDFDDEMTRLLPPGGL